MTYQAKEILQALTHVDDPDLNKDIVTLGMVRNINIVDHHISFDLVLTTPACPMKDMLENACRNAIKHFLPGEPDVRINVTSEVKNNLAKTGALSGVKNIIAVASGKGGVGKSTVSLSLALTLSRAGAKVGLLDADIYGPSQPILTGTESYVPESKEEAGKSILQAAEVEGLKVFSIGYLVKQSDPIAWRGPMLSSALRQFIQDVNWGDLDYLIVDLPPGTGDIQITLCQAVDVTGVVLVTTPQKIAVADARRALQMFRMQGMMVPVLGVVENMAWFETPQLPGQAFYIFGKGGGEALATEANVPYLGSIPLMENLSSDEKQGNILFDNPTMPYFAKVAGEMVRSLAIQLNRGSAQN
jgi:ATP-binding protein involved in chromosome partitioning